MAPRRVFLPPAPWRGIGGLGALASAGLVIYATCIEQRRLRRVHRRVPVRALPAALHGLRILHLSDLHLGAPHSGERHLRSAARLQADLVAVTGDLVDNARQVDRCADLLAAFRPPLGVWVVLGNHDYPSIWCHVDTEDLITQLRARGLQVLRNTAAPIEWRGGTFWLAGTDDPYKRRADLAATLGAVPRDAWTLLLAHSADILTELEPGRVGLVLAGHSHGGQVRLPGLPALRSRTRLRLPEPYGLRRVNGTLIHLHPGLGATIPLRFGMPPEATLLELCSDGDGPGLASQAALPNA
ncbi:MAG TPA: metallophosphoesterase [Chloroflexota bacterium]|jgi:hypothetical protein